MIDSSADPTAADAQRPFPSGIFEARRLLGTVIDWISIYDPKLDADRPCIRLSVNLLDRLRR